MYSAVKSALIPAVMPAVLRDAPMFWQADFTAMSSLPSTFTFSRASGGTYFNPTGTNVLAGNDVARFDTNPSTLAARGLLIEGARTNSILYSSTFSNAVWNVDNVSTSSVAAPDASSDAVFLKEDSTANSHVMFQDITKGASAITYAVSFYAKANGRDKLFLKVDRGSNGRVNTRFGLSGSGSILSGPVASGSFSVGAGGASIESIGNGWYRCKVSVTSDTGTNIRFVLYLDDGSGDVTTSAVSYTGDGTSGAIIWGTQVEAGSFATSYIPTAGSSATRAADVATIADLASVGFNAAGYTIYVKGEADGLVSPGSQNFITLKNANGGNSVELRLQSSGTAFLRTRTASSNEAGLTLGSVTANSTFKMAATLQASDIRAVLNGGTVQTSSYSPPTVTQAVIGDGPAATQAFGWVKEIKIFPYVMTNAQLQALTQ